MPKLPKKKIHTYSGGSLIKALGAVKSGAKIRPTCRIYGVPRATLQDRIKKRVSDNLRKMEPDQFLTLKNEEMTADWLTQLANVAFQLKSRNCLILYKK